jgi:hypothetical protein
VNTTSNGLVFITSIDNFYIINPQFTMDSRANQKYFAISAEITQIGLIRSHERKPKHNALGTPFKTATVRSGE